MGLIRTTLKFRMELYAYKKWMFFYFYSFYQSVVR